MTLGALSLSVTAGVQGRQFAAKINGLTTGKLEVLSDGAPGFSTSNGMLRSESLPYPVSTAVLREYNPGGSPSFKDTRLEITATTAIGLVTLAAAAVAGGRILIRAWSGATRDSDGALVWWGYAEDDYGSTTAFDLGGTPTPTPTAASPPTSTKTSSSGANPMAWSDDFNSSNAAVGDYEIMRWRVNGGAWNRDTDHLLTSDDFFDMVDGIASFNWPLYTAAAPFAAGAFIEVQPGIQRAGVDYWGTIISDTMAASASIAHLRSEAIDFGYGGGPGSPATAITCLSGDKIVVTLMCAFNGTQTVTSLTANSGAITFTPIGSSSAGASRVYSFYADTTGVTSLSLVINVSGSTQSVDVFVEAIRGGAAGAPASSYFEKRAVTSEDPIDIDGSLNPASGGVAIYTLGGAGGATITFSGATALAASVGSIITARSASKTTTSGDVTVAGHPSGLGYSDIFIANTAWNHA